MVKTPREEQRAEDGAERGRWRKRKHTAKKTEEVTESSHLQTVEETRSDYDSMVVTIGKQGVRWGEGAAVATSEAAELARTSGESGFKVYTPSPSPCWSSCHLGMQEAAIGR